MREARNKGAVNTEVMTAYIVMVRPGTNERYSDSIWISRMSADQRAASLVEEFSRRGRGGKVEYGLITGWGAWVSPVQIEDAVCVEEPPTASVEVSASKDNKEK